jgi:hypothetical protein
VNYGASGAEAGAHILFDLTRKGYFRHEIEHAAALGERGFGELKEHFGLAGAGRPVEIEHSIRLGENALEGSILAGSENERRTAHLNLVEFFGKLFGFAVGGGQHGGKCFTEGAVVHRGEPFAEFKRPGVEQRFRIDNPQNIADFVRGKARKVQRKGAHRLVFGRRSFGYFDHIAGGFRPSSKRGFHAHAYFNAR